MLVRNAIKNIHCLLEEILPLLAFSINCLSVLCFRFTNSAIPSLQSSAFIWSWFTITHIYLHQSIILTLRLVKMYLEQ